MASTSNPLSNSNDNTNNLSNSINTDILVNSGSVINPVKHNFHSHRFATPTYCKFCTKIIWGLGKHGFQCKDCKYVTHEKCLPLVPDNCNKYLSVNIRFSIGEKKRIEREKLDSFNDLVNALKSGIQLRERKTLLKTYPSCFDGKEAVSWMLQHLPIRDREEATNIGNKLMQRGYVKSVTEEKVFKDSENSFYIFQSETKVNPLSLSEDMANRRDEEEKNTSSVCFGDFEIIRPLGKGSYGMVLKVKHKETGKIYAMKVLEKTRITGERAFQGLMAEKKIMLNDNPFLVHLYFSFVSDVHLFFVMDYIPGGTLKYHLRSRGVFSEKETRFISAEVAIAIDYLHSCGVVYRDLKLENILLDKDGHICLTDFGLSKELRDAQSKTQTICGTPAYLAPEIILAEEYGYSVDWWSLGVVLVELLIGKNIFDSTDFESIISNVLHLKIELPDTISNLAKEVCFQLLQRNPKKRLCTNEGACELQNYEFYKSINWKELMIKNSKPPFTPKKDENFGAVSPSLPQAKSSRKGREFIDFDFESFVFSTNPEFLI